MNFEPNQHVKKCPLCGRDPHLIMGNFTFSVQCTPCALSLLSLNHETVPELLDRWNRIGGKE